MSGLNTYFVPLTILQEQFWDKEEDAPLAGGKLYFYQDEARTIPKPVYVLTGNPPDYSYAVATPSASVITLSSIGTVDDGMGNNLVIYGYPYDDNDFDGGGNIQLYYMTVYNADGQFQFAVGGFPNVPFEEVAPTTGNEKNLIKNGQFALNYGTKSISATRTNVAYGGWNYVRSSNTSTDTVSFQRFGSPIAGGVPSGNPRYACDVACSVTGADSSKVLQVEFLDVNRFSDPSQTLSLYFMAKSVSGSSISVNLYKNFGTGGSAPITTQIVESTPLTSSWTPISVSFPFGSNVDQTLGANNDDYFAIQVSFNPALTFDVAVTDFVLYLGTERITAYPFSLDPLQYVAPHYSAEVSSPVSLSTGTINMQPVTGTSITILPGTYLVNYGISAVIQSNNVVLYEASSQLYNVTAGAAISPTSQIVTTNTTGITSYIGGSSSYTNIITVTVPTTLQIYIGVNTVFNMVSFSATSANISALRLGWN